LELTLDMRRISRY